MTVLLHFEALAFVATSFLFAFNCHCSQLGQFSLQRTQMVLGGLVFLGTSVLVLNFLDFLCDTHLFNTPLLIQIFN